MKREKISEPKDIAIELSEINHIGKKIKEREKGASVNWGKTSSGLLHG